MPDTPVTDKQQGQDRKLQERIAASRNVVGLEFAAALGSADPDECNASLEKQDPDLYQDLLGIVKKRSAQLVYSRRMQIYRGGEAELYYLGKQAITWDGGGESWLGASPSGQFVPAYDDQAEEDDWMLNFYKAYGQSFETTASENVPPVPFIPVGSSREDLDGAKHATLASNLVARNNDAPMLMAKYAYHGWTGGLMATYTRSVTDGNAYGWKMDPKTDQPITVNGQKVPKSRVVVSVHGALDVTLPETVETGDVDHLAFHVDIPKSKGLATYPWLKTITPSANVSDDDILSRLFRVAVRANVPPRIPSESLDTVATLVRLWLKPSTFFEITDDARRAHALEKFPNGVCLHYLGGSFAAAIPDKLCDRWEIEFASEGRGARRPGWGDPYIQLQDQINILSTLWHQYLVRGAPTIFHKDKALNTAALKHMEAKPFQFVPVTTSEGPTVPQLFWASPNADVPPSLVTRLNDITVGTLAQFLTGIAPALTGIGLQGVIQETARGFERQIEKSQGKIALFYRRLRSLHQRTMLLAVREFARTEDQDAQLAAPGKKARRVSPIAIRKGNFCIYPEADEGRPVLFRDKREQLGGVLSNPGLAPSIPEFDNLDLIRRILGYPEWVITGEDAWIKQGKEIEELLSVPGDPQIAAAIATGQPPPEFPTVKIGPLDNDAVEFKRCLAFANSEEGMEAAIENPIGFENFLMHAGLHKQRMQEMAPPPPNPNEKPIGWTAALDKMPPEVLQQKLKEIGIEVSAESILATREQAKQKPVNVPVPVPTPVPAVAASSNGQGA